MEQKAHILYNRGMSQDTSISKVTNDFAYENYGIRITGDEDKTLLSVTNEKGPLLLDVDIDGTYLGHASIGRNLIVFTVNGNISYIYKIVPDESNIECLYSGNLGFNTGHPIETLSWYESEDIQKVYWVDGINVTRMVNICADITPADDYQFDFVSTVQTIPSIEISKSNDSSGLFLNGTIEYFVTFYKKFGRETPILNQSSLNYISHQDRGAKADETVACAFDIEVSGIDESYDYVRLYAVHRSSLNGTPTARIVADMSINGSTCRFTDYGNQGESFDADAMYYLGGTAFIPSTIAQKDGTLFFGNINLDVSGRTTSDDIRNVIASKLPVQKNADGVFDSPFISFVYKELPTKESNEGFYSHDQQINYPQEIIGTFKSGEIYRFAIQFMNRYGEWNSPIWIGDKRCNLRPVEDSNSTKVATAKFTWNNALNAAASSFTSYRILYAETSAATRSILAQGVVNPTLFNYSERVNNEPYGIASWNFRPNGSDIAHRHLQSIGTQYGENAELQGVTKEVKPFSVITNETFDPGRASYKYYTVLMSYDKDGGVLSKSHRSITYMFIAYNIPEDAGALQAFAKGNNAITDYVVVSRRRVVGNTWEKAVSSMLDCIAEDSVSVLGKNAMPVLYQNMPKQFTNTYMGSLDEYVKPIYKDAIASVASGKSTDTYNAVRNAINDGIDTYIGSEIIVATSLISLEGIKAAISDYASISQDNAMIAQVPLIYASHGWMFCCDGSSASTSISRVFSNLTHDFEKSASIYSTGGVLTAKSVEEALADECKDQYYVDTNIVTLHSPEITENEDLLRNNDATSMRIVGTIPVHSVYNKFTIDCNRGLHLSSGILQSAGTKRAPMDSLNIEGLISGYMYQDTDIPRSIIKSIESGSGVVPYKVFLWNRDTSLSVGGGHGLPVKMGDTEYQEVARLNHKVFSNLRFSRFSRFFPDNYSWDTENSHVTVFDSDEVVPMIVKSDLTESNFYLGNYDNLVTFTEGSKYEILTEDNYSLNTEYNEYEVNLPFGRGRIIGKTPAGYSYEYLQSDTIMVADPIRIKYKSTPHAVVALPSIGSSKIVLPSMKDEVSVKINDLYPGIPANAELSEIGSSGYLEVAADIDGYTVLLDQYGRVASVDFSNATSDIDVQDGTIVVTKTGNAGTSASNIMTTLVAQLFPLYQSIVIDRVFNELKSSTKPVVLVTFTDASGVKTSSWAELKNLAENVGDTYIMELIELPDGKTVSTIVVNDALMNSSVGRISGMGITVMSGTYSADTLPYDAGKQPYLFIGEIYKRNFDYDLAYGGHDDNAIENLDWIVCSRSSAIGNDVSDTWGDTYYQRWDCLKTYPFTEEDRNSIVDILSFKVETHINIDGRSDINRGIKNILNARPTNWNIMNPVYSQQDNFFKYKTLDSKFDLDKFGNQVAWSLPKADTADIDSWLGVTLNNSLSLDGNYGNVTKLINLNDTVIAFQEKGIAAINFNNQTAISTETGAPLEIMNSGRVNGYTYITQHSGCINKWSVVSSGYGAYFMDDLNRSFMRLSKEGLENIGMKHGMSSWFKENSGKVWSLNGGGIKSGYDNIASDVYIVSDNTALLFNERLQAFTSFMPYEGHCGFINLGGKLYSLRTFTDKVKLYEMFGGRYNVDHDGRLREYSMTFQVNPDPLEDKVFTNIEYMADVLNPDKSVNGINVLLGDNPFSYLDAWNEYQNGHSALSHKITPSELKHKFRIWRADIPRDGKSRYGIDRIRNPWCFLRLTKNADDTNKMVFHQILVKYFK